jgi:uncharacterized OB-fold protein
MTQPQGPTRIEIRPDSEIKIRVRCEACGTTGWSLQAFCPSCNSTGWIEHWVPITALFPCARPEDH